jgi:pimeloyl-ACP methyl ester carboxylesterase
MKSVAISVLGALTVLHGPAQSRTVNVGDAVINYEIVGVGDPLVLIHGWAQDLSIWDDQVREFSKHYRKTHLSPPALSPRDFPGKWQMH